ncbi:MAG: fibronectin type III domain-containing protein [Nitrospira sp.]|nr:fibronectin type III domain-containing protein [Nitrospira sp.]MDH4370275.1 fibronectin type III domain-containing protein [Nitrospira sp.]MDH5347857.1 fibronectin type III domain-containing protein [Nitrospira sp.]MDH5498314.1 fibronectin type III domain-containing protein [Nitrospira sp.]MDH5726427.1 fibronectin type III domain-containing protein [Nitrospira sp.]
MLENASSVGFLYRQFTRSIAGLIILGVIALPLTGCSDNEGGGGPAISSLSTSADTNEPTNTTDDSTLDPTLEEPVLGGEEPIDSPLLLAEGTDADSSTDLVPDLNASDPEEDSLASLIDAPQGKPTISMASTPTGAAASVMWQPVPDPKVKGYYVHYGKQPSEDPGVCAYDDRIAAEAPDVTIAELEPNTPYFFAVSAYGSLESPCSSEASAITPPAGA